MPIGLPSLHFGRVAPALAPRWLLPTGGTALALLCTSLSLSFPSGVRAVDEPRVNCDDIGTTYEANVCSQREFDAADQKLNAAFKQALAYIAENGGDKPWDAKSWEEKLRAAQRAWLAYRDADCKDAVPMEWSGGTGTTAAVLGCMTEKTEARTKDLEARFQVR